MRLAAIDVGSNSVHMVIADVTAGGHLDVVDRVKETIRLGSRSFTTGRLRPEAMDLAIRALGHFVHLARVRKVDRVRAVATSAVREARNRDLFIKRLRRETGLAVRVVTGAEEARLIFRAARHALGLEGGPDLLVDIGGGSVELVLVQDRTPLLTHSTALGAVRLMERFLLADPPTASQIERLEEHLENELGDLLHQIRKAGVKRAIGISGAANTLVAMARAARGQELGRLHGATASAAEIARLRRHLLEENASGRAEIPGMDSKRADIMPAPAILMDFILSRIGEPELMACTWALREGLMLELAEFSTERSETALEIRRRSVQALAQRFAGRNRHGRQVARLSLRLFDALAERLDLPAGSRELLQYAALLHDIGHAIDHDRHNRHTCYLIQNAELLGFDPVEIDVIAQAARGHRKQAPKLASPELQALSAGRRRQVRGIAAILRVADAVDRSHFSVVKDLHVSLSSDRLLIEVDSADDGADLELWATERRTDLLSRLLDRKVVLRASAPVATRTRAIAAS
jgi:exopolyphosphatase/guanosine-5'-triphosphate,3'-diphosphate pyrophosphatase